MGRRIASPRGGTARPVSPAGGDHRAHPTKSAPERARRARRLPHYVGPVNWDISAADYDFWRRGASPNECAEAYLERIERIGRGIVLLHDSSEEEWVRRHNQALALTRILVPALRQRGYRFVRLDAIPQVREAARAARTLRTAQAQEAS